MKLTLSVLVNVVIWSVSASGTSVTLLVLPSRIIVATDSLVGCNGRTDQVKSFVSRTQPALKGVIFEGEYITIAFFRFRHGRPEVFLRGFRGAKVGKTTEASLVPQQSLDCSPCDGLPREPTHFGVVSGYVKDRKRHPEKYPRNAYTIEFARYITQLEIDEDPAHVGAPIQALSLTANGEEVHDVGACPWR